MRRGFSIALLCAAAVTGAVGTAARAPDLPVILVSRPLLEAQRLSPGDVISLSADPSGANPRQFRIAGQYEPVPDPMRLGALRHEVRLHLPDLLEMVTDPTDPQAAESVDAINVGLEHPADEAAYRRAIVPRLPGAIVRSIAGDDWHAAPFVVLDRFHLAIAIVTVVASSIFLLALMLMLVDERRETVGILRLIGFRRGRILLLVFAEGIVLAVAGALVGIALSTVFQGSINRFFQWRYDTALVFVRITPAVALRSVAMAVPLGVLAAVGSSWALLRREVFSLTRR